MNKHNKLVAWGLISSIGLAIITGMGVFGVDSEDSIYTLVGLGMIAFGIWAIVILFKTAEK